MKILHKGKAIIIGDEKLDLNEFPNLKIIGCPMTGVDHLPIQEIEKRGIKLITLREFPFFLKGITSTAEHTFGLIIALLRNYKSALHAPYNDRETYKGHTLSDKTLGIIGGNGRIGRQVKQIAKGFGIKVLTYDIYDDFKWLGRRKKKSKLEYLLRNSDIVSIHIPLGGNKNFFSDKDFGFMKSSAHLINTSRNSIVEKEALLWALENNIIAGAAVDFIDDEDLVSYANTHDNLILTNHIGGMTFEDREKTDALILKVVENFISENKL